MWVTGVSEEEMGEADSPVLHSPNSPRPLRVLELQEVLGFSLMCWSDLLPG